MNEEQFRLLDRLYRQQEGRDFVEEILIPLLSQNHMDLLSGNKDIRDELIGYGGALKYLIESFKTANAKLETAKQTEAPAEWM